MNVVHIAWTVLIISAVTDFIITTATALGTAMMATGAAAIPNDAVIVVALLGGLASGARTIQQKLNSTQSTPEATRALKGTGDGNG